MKHMASLAVLLAAAVYATVPAMAASPATHKAVITSGNSSGPEDSANDMPRAKAPAFDIATLRDPFESYLTVLAQQNQRRMQQLRTRITEHTHEPLESFDLSALTLVATMQMGGKRVAMVQDPQGKGYMVHEGSYIGRDNGRVVKITDRNVVILEDDFTPTGELVKRKTTLTLNEVNTQQ